MSRVRPESRDANDGSNFENVDLTDPRIGNGAEKLQKSREAETWPEIIRAWPKTTICIVSNEFCERFSYYGMRTVLVIYLWNFLGYSQNSSSVLFNGFTVLCYFSPLLGSILADGYVGKFHTILWVSLLYAFGQIVLAAASTLDQSSPFHPYADIAGLVIIGLGTGGIKPCVASFGGDQFDPHQVRMISLFFSVFYFSINAGSMISTFITPIFRAKSCLGQSTCFPLAFGLPAALMIVAVVVFVLGSPWYKRNPPKENIFAQVFHVVTMALANRSNSDKLRRDKDSKHWLDRYFDTHDCQSDAKCVELHTIAGVSPPTFSQTLCHKRKFVADLKSLTRILVMFLPVPIFWALYDQQGSRWVIQSFAMETRLWSGYSMIPDQMQTLNAVLILAFIPLFQIIIYPLVECCFKLTALRKMVGGGMLASLSFVISTMVQLRVNNCLPLTPPAGNGFVSVINSFDHCMVNVTPWQDFKYHSVGVAPNQALFSDRVANHFELIQVQAGSTRFDVVFSGADCGVESVSYNYVVDDGATHYFQLGPNGALFETVDPNKPTTGKGDNMLRVTLGLTKSSYTGLLALCSNETNGCQKAEDQFYTLTPDINHQNETYMPGPSSSFATIYKSKEVQLGTYNLYYLDNLPVEQASANESSAVPGATPLGASITITDQGGVYEVWVGGTKESPKTVIFQVTPPNEISILWQVPQIVVITASEILFSISGLEFAYAEAAPSMKSLVQACWLLTSAIGDSIIVIIALFNISDMAVEFIFYAVLMFVVILIFALMAIFFYEYSEDSQVKAAIQTDDHQRPRSRSRFGSTTTVGRGRFSSLISPKSGIALSTLDEEDTFSTVQSSSSKKVSSDLDQIERL